MTESVIASPDAPTERPPDGSAQRVSGKPTSGRARLALRWARFAAQSLRSKDFDFVANAIRAECTLAALAVRDLVPTRVPRARCNICDWSGRGFYPNVGPGYNEYNTLCPGCRTLARHRSLMFVLKRRTEIFTRKCRLIEVAPMRPFHHLFLNMPQVDYTSFDLERFALERGDITAMRFADNEADYFLCFHVLEHIPAERLALAEIHRVLKPGGELIIQVPVDWSVERTYEYEKPDPREVGHVRRYGRDFSQRIADHGFELTAVDPKVLATLEEYDAFRLDADPVFLAKKV